MKAHRSSWLVVITLALLVAGLPGSQRGLRAQPWWPYGPPPPPAPSPTTPDAQRNALSNLRTRVVWLQNATRSACNFNDGVSLVWQQFQYLRGSYGAFTSTLNPQQKVYGANELAELEAGLDILQEAFANYERDVAGGRPVRQALAELCQVMREASAVWLQELNKDAIQLQVGRF